MPRSSPRSVTTPSSRPCARRPARCAPRCPTARRRAFRRCRGRANRARRGAMRSPRRISPRCGPFSTPRASSCTRISDARRSPTPRSTACARSAAATRNLEYDLGAGARGTPRRPRRGAALPPHRRRSGASSSTTAPAATLLVLAALAPRTRGPRLARRARRDRRRLPRARRDGAVGRDAARGGHDESRRARRTTRWRSATEPRASCASIRPISASKDSPSARRWQSSSRSAQVPHPGHRRSRKRSR